jgi:hypothetical protein
MDKFLAHESREDGVDVDTALSNRPSDIVGCAREAIPESAPNGCAQFIRSHALWFAKERPVADASEVEHMGHRRDQLRFER